MDWKKFWKVFHKTWGECHESPEYNKQNWLDMQEMLEIHMLSEIKVGKEKR